MRITLTWLGIDSRRCWRSLLVLVLLVALATATVLAATAGARRGQSVVERLYAGPLPATVTVLPNQPGFDWAKVRACPRSPRSASSRSRSASRWPAARTRAPASRPSATR
jgi:hypothetical protein